MANNQIYQKYGVTVSPDGVADMMAGQQATAKSFKDALAGVNDLLKTQKAKYADTNTSNMQEYLKGKIRDDGLGAPETDQDAIKAKYGDLINMEQIGSTVTNQKRLLEEAAVNTASGIANTTLSETNDPVAARQKFVESMAGVNAPNSLISASSQAWSDANDGAIKDATTLELRAGESRLTSVLDEISISGDRDIAIENSLAGLSKDKEGPERRRLKAAVEKEALLTDEQKERVTGHMERFNIQGQRTIAAKEQEAAQIQAQVTALAETGIRDASYKLANEFASKLGGSTANAIGDKVTNWMESFSNTSDAKEVKRINQELIDSGIKPEDAEAALAQAFNERYPGDRFWGNDIDDMPGVEARAKALGSASKNINSLNGSLSAARAAVDDETMYQAEESSRLRDRLVNAGRRTNLRVQNASTVDQEQQDYFRSRLGRTSTDPTTGPPTSPGAVGAPYVPTDDEVQARVTANLQGGIAFSNPGESLRGGGAVVRGSASPIPVDTTSGSTQVDKQPSNQQTQDFVEQLRNSPAAGALKSITNSLQIKQNSKDEEDLARLAKSNPQLADTLQEKLRARQQTGPDIVGGINIKSYATNKEHEANIAKIYKGLPKMDTSSDIGSYITKRAPNSPVTADMVSTAAKRYGIEPKILIAIMLEDSTLGTEGKGVRTMNPGNVGNDDTGKLVFYDSWEAGVMAAAKNLSKRKANS